MPNPREGVFQRWRVIQFPTSEWTCVITTITTSGIGLLDVGGCAETATDPLTGNNVFMQVSDYIPSGSPGYDLADWEGSTFRGQTSGASATLGTAVCSPSANNWFLYPLITSTLGHSNLARTFDSFGVRFYTLQARFRNNASSGFINGETVDFTRA